MANLNYVWGPSDSFAINCPECAAYGVITKMEPLEVEPKRSDVYLNAVQLCPLAHCRYIHPWFPGLKQEAI